MPLDLSLTRHEGGPATPMMIAHGLLGHARNWATLGKRFASGRDVLTVDMRNHGDSPWDDAMDYAAMAGDLSHMITKEASGAAVVLGHSMGGKAAMTLALTRPEKVQALIVADMAPVTYTHDYETEFAAMRAVDPGAISRRSEADAILKRHIPDMLMRGFLLQNLSVGSDGIRWKPNIDVLANSMANIVGWQEPEGAAPYSGPTLFLAGENSDYVTAAREAEILRLFPQAEIARVAGAGHWLHAEQPDLFHTAVQTFLKKAA